MYTSRGCVTQASERFDVTMENPAFHRQVLLSGKRVLDALAQTRVILFGVGGVGSWCAESLIRSGIEDLTIVDSDLVCVTNINRQLHAPCRYRPGQPGPDEQEGVRFC